MQDKPTVYVFNTDYDSIRDSVDRVFELFPFDFKDKLVWVKPNMLGNYKPEKHVTTNPALISAVVGKLTSLHARVVVGDNSGVPSILSEDRVARESGIFDAAMGTFHVISKEVVRVSIDKNGINESINISKIAKDCDIMISLPKMKTHLHTFITGAVKNSYGLVVGVQKPNLHLKHPGREDFAKLIAEIYNLRKPDLVIMDGIVAIEGDGPNSPDLRKVGRLIASEDGVALDHYAARVMGMDARRIPLLVYCVQSGIGSGEYAVQGDGGMIEGFKLPRTYYDSSIKNHSFLEHVLYKYVTGKKLRIDEKACTRCLSCSKVCPAGAILTYDYPSIDGSKCILCYCCRENCKHHAINFSLSYRIMQKLMFLRDRWLNR